MPDTNNTERKHLSEPICLLRQCNSFSFFYFLRDKAMNIRPKGTFVVQYCLIWDCKCQQFYWMEEGLLDISKIPRFQFQVHNEQLTNCIKELHFHLKTQEKRVEKCRKDIDLKIAQSTLGDLFNELTAALDIHPNILKALPSHTDNRQQGGVRGECNKLGSRLSQLAEAVRVLWEKFGGVERRQEQAQSAAKQQVSERVQALQAQLDDLKKGQARDNRTQGQAVMLAQNRFEQKLKEVESKTLWQINDCKVKLNDRVNEQFVRDQVREAQTKLINKMREAAARNAIDPQTIDALETRCIRQQKELEVKAVEMNARINELRDYVNHHLATKKEIGLEKLQGEKRNGNIQVAIAEASLKLKTIEQETKEAAEDIKGINEKQDSMGVEVSRLTKLVSNLKLSEDFMKLMERLDPHKICQMDTSIATLEERQLKDEKEVEALRRYMQKFKEKVQLGNIVSANEQHRGLDKEDVTRILQDLLLSHPTLKKVSSLEGQLYELRAYGDSIAQLSKKMGKVQKEFDLQPVVYGLRGLEQYMKKELLIVNTKVSQLESQLSEQRRRRPLSAKKISSDSRITSSVSFKKLVPVDCISCFQNPIGERTPERFKR